jgi:hypothetical protein
MSSIHNDLSHHWDSNSFPALIKLVILTAFTAGLIFSKSAIAAIECDDDREPTTFHIIIDPEIESLPPRLAYPGADSAVASTITIQWPSANLPERAYMNEVFSIDLENEAVSLVDGIDGRARAENPEIRALAQDEIGLAQTELLASDFGLGLVNAEACMDPDRDAGLVFVLYQDDSEDVGFQVAPFTVRESGGNRIAVVAPNEGTSDQVGLEFNSAGADAVMDIMEEASGTDTYDMARVNAENIYQESVPFIFAAEDERNAKFGDPEDAIVHSDKVVVVGRYPAVRVANGVDVYRNGQPRKLYANRIVSGLRGYLDFNGKATLELSVTGYEDRRVIQLLEGDTALTTEASDCTDKARITADFVQPSLLKGLISLYDDDKLLVQVEDDLDLEVDCDGSVYTLVGERFLEGVDIPATEKLGYAFIDPNREFTFIGLDFDGDGDADRLDADQDGILDGAPLAIGCNDSEPRKDYIVVDPPLDERTYTFTEDNAPSGWQIIAPNLVQYDADCADADTTVSPHILGSDGTTNKGLTVKYKVSE